MIRVALIGVLALFVVGCGAPSDPPQDAQPDAPPPLSPEETAAATLEKPGALITRGAGGKVTGVNLPGNTKVTDDDLQHLAALTGLRELTLSSEISDKGLKHLAHSRS